jgi:hypothetical protein
MEVQAQQIYAQFTQLFGLIRDGYPTDFEKYTKQPDL